MANITILGGGGWGVALSCVLSDNQHNVTIWSFLQSEADVLRTTRENPRSLPGVLIGDSVRVTTDLEQAVTEAEVIVMATASSYVRKTARSIAEYVQPGQLIVNVAKGIEEETLKTMTEVISDELPSVNPAVLSGPSHAEEVGKRMPTYVVVGAADKETAEYIQELFANPVFRVYTSPDVLGIELGGSLKNVIALAAGIPGNSGDQQTGQRYGRQYLDVCGIVRNRGSDRNLCQYAFQKPPRRYPDRTGKDDGRSDGGSPDGSGRRIFRKSCPETRSKIRGRYADH